MRALLVALFAGAAVAGGYFRQGVFPEAAEALQRVAAALGATADIEIPERRITMSMVIRRDLTQVQQATSHTIEITFNLPADFPFGGIQNVPGILMKQAEQTRGSPLGGAAAKVTSGYFLIGLSAVETDMQRNIQLLKERNWFDIPIVYNNGRSAILAIEKAGAGVVLYIPPKGDLVRELEVLHRSAMLALPSGQTLRSASGDAGQPWTLREFGLGAQVLSDLGVHQLRLLTNSQSKIAGITGFGLKVVERVPLVSMKGEA